MVSCALTRPIFSATNTRFSTPNFALFNVFGFWANPVPSLDDEVRMLQQNPRVQLSSLRRHLSPVLVCSLRLLQLNTFSQCWWVLRKLQHRARRAHNRSNHSSMLKQTTVVHLMKLSAPRKNLDGTNTVFFSPTPDHKTIHSFHFVHALPSRVGTVCFRFVFHVTARSAIHGRLFYLLISSPCFPLCCFRLAMGCF